MLDAIDKATVPDLVSVINQIEPVTHELQTSGLCGPLTYSIKELADYSWLSLDTNIISVTPDSDTIPDTYQLTIQIINLEVPF